MSVKCALELLESNRMINKTIIETSIEIGHYIKSETNHTVKSEKSINLPLIFIKVEKEDEYFKNRFIELMESKGYISPKFDTASGYYCKEKDVDMLIDELLQFSDDEKFYMQFEKKNMWPIISYINQESDGRFMGTTINELLYSITDNQIVEEKKEKRRKQKENDLEFLEKVFK